MKVRNKNIDETIYSICLLIHKICKLNLDFIGSNSSFELVSSPLPATLDAAKVDTLTYIHNFLKNEQPTDILYHTDNFSLTIYRFL